MIYGYARVSSKGQALNGNSLDEQERILTQEGATVIYKEVFTGTKNERPELEKLLAVIDDGDTLVVTKLDRLARSVQAGSTLIKELIDKGVAVRILNMGTSPIDNSPTGTLMFNILLSFAQFERDMIWERTQEGKAVSGNYGGRKKKYTREQLNHAMNLLNDHSFNQVARMTGISKSTLIREKKAKS